MDSQMARTIFDQIQAAGAEEPLLVVLKREWLQQAVRYARLRTDWQLVDAEEQRELDEPRRLAHNAFIDTCNILSRAMARDGHDISWRDQLGYDRATIGDFACFIHCFVGLAAR